VQLRRRGKELGQTHSGGGQQNVFLQIHGGEKPSTDGAFESSEGILMMVLSQKKSQKKIRSSGARILGQ
jgi:hypothetical protein